MDYRLAALKLLCSQLREALPHETSSSSSSPPNSFSLYGILLQRAWLQGVLVRGSLPDGQGRGAALFLDDGTGLAELDLTAIVRDPEWKSGMYVMVVGNLVLRCDGVPQIKVHKMVDLSAYPDREAMWHLEVIEANKLFYESPCTD